MARLTIMAMERRLNQKSDSLFTDSSLPDGYDKDVLKNRILLDTADFECLYSDPYFLQEAMENWFLTWKESFEKWWEVLHTEYNPIENYDREESSSGSNSLTGSGSTSSSSSGNSHNGTTTLNKVSAYDSTELATEGQNDSASDLTSANTDNSASNSEQYSQHQNTARTHGNIGVTTTQQMINSELELRKKNLYEDIANLFCEQFCLLIY